MKVYHGTNYQYLVLVAEKHKNDQGKVVRFQMRSVLSFLSLTMSLMLFYKYKIPFSEQPISEGTRTIQLSRSILLYNRVSSTRLWQKTAQPTLAA